MKKILCVLFAAVMILGLLAGCSKAEDPTDASTDPSTEATTEVTSEPTEESTGPEAETTEVTDGEDVDSADESSNSGSSSNSGNSSNGSSSGSGNSSKPSASGGSSSSGGSSHSGGSSGSGSSSGSSHTHSYNSTVVAPTCTTGGYTKHTCSCGKSYTDSETSATGHSWGGWVTTKEPTTSSEGQQTRTCGSCGATESQSIAKLPAPALDLKAAMAQGNAYAQSRYGWYIDTSFNPDISGYEPPYDMDLNRTTEKGQEYLNRRMRESVDALYDSLCADPDGPDGYTINCVIREVNGVLWLYVCF